MTQVEFNKSLALLGFTQASFARLMGMTPRAVNQWARGIVDVPSPIAAYLRLLDSAPDELKYQELLKARKENE